MPRGPTASRSAGSMPLGGDPLGQLGDVLAFVAVLGRLGPGHPGGDRVGEAADLAAGVVDVELALDLVADRLEQPRPGRRRRRRGGRRRRAAARSGWRRRTRPGSAPGERSAPGRGARPAAARRAIARRYQASARKRLTKPGPATSIRSRLPEPPRSRSSSARSRSATARGLSPERRRRAASPRWSCSRPARASAAGPARAPARSARRRAGRGPPGRRRRAARRSNRWRVTRQSYGPRPAQGTLAACA